MWVRIVLRLSIELEEENWRLTRRGLLHQYFQSLSARSLKQKIFKAKRHLSVFYIMRSCFLDAGQTRLGSNHRTNLELSSAFAIFAGKIWRRRR